MQQMDGETADAGLIKRFLHGDEAAFSTLYHRYRRQLYAFLNNLIGAGAECDEVFEETWLKGVCEKADQWLSAFDLTGIL